MATTKQARPVDPIIGTKNPMINSTRLAALVETNRFWTQRLQAASSGHAGLHLGVFSEPYLTYILQGKKTVESRFGATKQPPFQRVGEGDILLLKRSAGPIVAIANVSDVWYYELEGIGFQSVVERFGCAMCLEDEFIRTKSSSAFATLIRLDHVQELRDMKVHKRDRRGWVVLRQRDAL